jgi:energy-coupling factor transporter ATP-binding protein EcfA2
VAFQSEELAQNTFGSTIAGDYGHIFNPKTKDDRELIARHGYIASLKHQRYVEPIDRLVRNAVAPSAAKIEPLHDSTAPTELLSALRDRKKLENQILLLVGSVGAGKSTFVDHLSLVALPEDLRSKTLWLRIDLNDAPLSIDDAYKWLTDRMVDEFRSSYPTVDFDHVSMLEKLFSYELSVLKKGALAVLDQASTEYKTRLADALLRLQSTPLSVAKGMTKFLCTAGGRLLIVVLDNCDKRTRDEQLTMFQIAHWVQSEFKCLVVLPLRDVTYDLHRNDPPLDTALKQFVFRIEPPPFSDVLQARIRLALEEMGRQSERGGILTFQLPNGIKVSYPSEDQSLYLASILRSLYAHDRFVRQVMTGLAGRDVRKALEIFLDFCMSGHIGEDEIYKIRFFEGQHVLPLSVVARVLLRMHRRFYDGDKSYLKNILQCAPEDPLPDHFVRLTLLHWFEQRLRTKGPAGVEGFHRVSDMVTDLSALGHDSERVRKELGYLAREGCVVAEHLRADQISDHDLVKVTASGVVHLQLTTNPEYLSACAEDIWMSDIVLAKRVADRISQNIENHFSPVTTARNTRDILAYLSARSRELLRMPGAYLSQDRAGVLDVLRRAEENISAAEVALADRLFVGGISFDSTESDIKAAFGEKGIAISQVIVPRDRKSGKSRGFAFVRMAEARLVLDALDLDGQIVVGGRRARISEAHALDDDAVGRGGGDRPAPALTTRVFLGNLPYEFDSGDIRAMFSHHDLTPIDIFVLTDRTSGRSKGVAFVEMKTLDEAAKAIGAIEGTAVRGRTLSARPADPRGPARRS